MIVNLALSFVYTLLGAVLSAFDLLPIPSGVSAVMQSGLGYIIQGLRVVASYVHFPYLLSLFLCIAAFDLALFTYKCVMWFLRKIPFWGVVNG